MLPDLCDNFLIRSANSIYDDEFRQHLVNSGYAHDLMTQGFASMDRQEEYLDFFPEWIASSQKNRFRGIENFPYRYISLGCTQMLDEFHDWCHQHGKTIRMFRGEYPYNRDCISFDWDRDFLDDRELQKGDAVIISLPFSGSGSIHSRWQELLGECERKDIPIAVDCAFFGTCFGIEVNLDHPNIFMVAFSTTKGLSCGNWRNGITFSRWDQGHLAVQTEWHHGIHLNVAFGLELMRNFSPDFLVNKYQKAAEEACTVLQLKTTHCIHLALGDDRWDYFSRDGVYNRVGLRNAVKVAHKRQKQKKNLVLDDFRS